MTFYLQRSKRLKNKLISLGDKNKGFSGVAIFSKSGCSDLFVYKIDFEKRLFASALLDDLRFSELKSFEYLTWEELKNLLVEVIFVTIGEENNFIEKEKGSIHIKLRKSILELRKTLFEIKGC